MAAVWRLILCCYRGGDVVSFAGAAKGTKVVKVTKASVNESEAQWKDHVPGTNSQQDSTSVDGHCVESGETPVKDEQGVSDRNDEQLIKGNEASQDGCDVTQSGHQDASENATIHAGSTTNIVEVPISDASLQGAEWRFECHPLDSRSAEVADDCDAVMPQDAATPICVVGNQESQSGVIAPSADPNVEASVPAEFLSTECVEYIADHNEAKPAYIHDLRIDECDKVAADSASTVSTYHESNTIEKGITQIEAKEFPGSTTMARDATACLSSLPSQSTVDAPEQSGNLEGQFVAVNSSYPEFCEPNVGIARYQTDFHVDLPAFDSISNTIDDTGAHNVTSVSVAPTATKQPLIKMLPDEPNSHVVTMTVSPTIDLPEMKEVGDSTETVQSSKPLSLGRNKPGRSSGRSLFVLKHSTSNSGKTSSEKQANDSGRSMNDPETVNRVLLIQSVVKNTTSEESGGRSDESNCDESALKV